MITATSRMPPSLPYEQDPPLPPTPIRVSCGLALSAGLCCIIFEGVSRYSSAPPPARCIFEGAPPELDVTVFEVDDQLVRHQEPSLPHPRHLSASLHFPFTSFHLTCLPHLPSPSSLIPFPSLWALIFSQSQHSCSCAPPRQAMEQARKVVAAANKARAFTDTGKFSIRCLVCQLGLLGEKEAVEHAKSTGHTNFSEYK